jgi:DNA-binding MarR family transcriptional regulator
VHDERAATHLRALIQQFVRSFGLLSAERTPCGMPLATSHAHALMILLERAQRNDRTTQQELGAILGIDKSNVARLCAKMQRSGHVVQLRDPSDGRARLLSLTSSGRRLAEKVETSSRRRFARLLSALPRDGAQAAVLASLEILNGAIRVAQRGRPA